MMEVLRTGRSLVLRRMISMDSSVFSGWLMPFISAKTWFNFRSSTTLPRINSEVITSNSVWMK